MKIGLSNPLNYTGSKYRYLSELQAILPQDKSLSVCDPFVGGGDLCSHLDISWPVFASDAMPQVIEMHNAIKSGRINTDDVMSKAYKQRLHRSDKASYLEFREFYNKNKNATDLYILLCHSNSNRIRFCKKGNFNMTFGERWFNGGMQKKLDDYIKRLWHRDITFECADFSDLHFANFDITLIDPPYLNSVATYNESGGWTESDEIQLQNKVKAECKKFVYFGQIWSNGKHNKLLDDFSKNYNVKILKDTTKHCSANRKDDKTVEIMFWNF